MALAKFKYAKGMRRMRVRIDVVRFAIGRQCKRFELANAQVCSSKEIGLAECARRLVPLVNQLCEVLKESAPNLSVLEICWHDNFGEGLRGNNMQLRANVLVPLASLDGIYVRICKRGTTERGRNEVMTMARQI